MDTDSHYIKQLQEIGRELVARNLVAGAAGNISMKSGQGDLYVTARGSQLGRLSDADIVKITPDGTWPPSQQPTSEYMIHTLFMKAYKDVRVVLHTHSAYATAAAILGEDIPPIVDEMTILIGGGLPVAPYAPPGSETLARAALKAMGDRRAVLLSNHGAVVVGDSAAEALKIAELVEHVAKVYLLVKTAGPVRAIPDEAFEKQRAAYLKKWGL
jgi:L-fuculose-phosphate aldolase